MKRILQGTFVALMLAMPGLPVTAQDRPVAGVGTVLTVIGAPAADSIALDMADLHALGSESFRTRTIWTEGVQRFDGVRLHALLAHLGVDAGHLRLHAVNDYTNDIPVSDATPDGPLIAWARNEQPMSLRDKGPLWLVYPYDADPAYQSEVIYARSVWQLDRIEVLAP